ncbi:hypothetical protein AXG93_3507s1340 [Marchantia polymorpha subsp. ruderalis]|uniref:Uncharacterized protein n=1 Tax=Marchantia polymorpha subsp. ruderalis TaxID=1480154 RepID=A0A176VFV8_MARPO|nr:hypothetical protein AXG93_3507s1340 [Marchantia polymorpha subsp. ruderalis]
MAVIYGSCKTAVLPSFFYQALDSPPPQRRNSTPFAHSPKFARRAFMSLGLSLFMSGQSWEAQAIEDVGLKNGQLRSCDGATPCVSTSAFRSPSRFMPPWSYLNSKDKAYDELLKALQRMGAQIVVKDDDTYIYATIAQPNDVDDVDDLEFLFVVRQTSLLQESLEKECSRSAILLVAGLHKRPEEQRAHGKAARRAGLDSHGDRRGEGLGPAALALTTSSSSASGDEATPP